MQVTGMNISTIMFGKQEIIWTCHGRT